MEGPKSKMMLYWGVQTNALLFTAFKKLKRNKAALAGLSCISISALIAILHTGSHPIIPPMQTG
jgi:hypothetical protein